MKTKLRLFKHTFVILGVMCCLLLTSSSIIFALSGFNSPDKNDKQVAQTTAGGTSSAVPSAAEKSISGDSSVSDTTEPSANTEPADKSAASSDTAVNAGRGTAGINTAEDDTENSSGTLKNDTSDTEALPANSEPQANPDNSITISAVGDIMAHQSNLNNAYSPKTGIYDFSGFLEYVRPYLTKSDLTIGNFETVTAGPSFGYTSYPTFNTPDSILTALFGAGFDILSTANNHSLDKGINGLTRTIQMINKNKIVNIGSSVNGRNKFIIKDVKGIKLGILAYSGFYNGIDKKLTAAQKSTYLSPINETQIQKDINAAKASRADAIIVVMHWGIEYQREPASSQTALAKKMLSWGADAILGSHPHVVQKSEISKVGGKNKFVIYSMGNFISGYRRIDKANRPNKIFTEDGVIVNLQITKDPNKGTIINDIDYIPTWVDKYYVNDRPVFKIIPIPDGKNISGKYATDYNTPFIKQSYKNTMGIMAKMR